MIKNVSLMMVIAVLSGSAVAAPQDYWPKTVQYFTDGTQSPRELRVAERLMRDTDYRVYDVTFAAGYLKSLEDMVPEKVWKQGNEVTEAFIRANVLPDVKKNAEKIAESKVGLSLMKVYGLERLPAVVIDGKYTTYGLSVSDSVKQFQWHKHKEASQ